MGMKLTCFMAKCSYIATQKVLHYKMEMLKKIQNKQIKLPEHFCNIVVSKIALIEKIISKYNNYQWLCK